MGVSVMEDKEVTATHLHTESQEANPTLYQQHQSTSVNNGSEEETRKADFLSYLLQTK